MFEVCGTMKTVDSWSPPLPKSKPHVADFSKSVFAPTFFIDGDAAGSASSRKRGVIGLSNVGNDCFINSVLQALAGLGDLRLYLIRETHRRKLDGPEVYSQLVEDPGRKNLAPVKIEGLQTGLVTHGLKDILDSLNERPLYKKTISAAQFISCLETAFKQRISRQQQDAQEFLQVVAERLCDEYHAGQRARRVAREVADGYSVTPSDVPPSATTKLGPGSAHTVDSRLVSENLQVQSKVSSDFDDEDGFPMEGGSESQIECLTCNFKPEATKTTFCSLTLSVPQVNSTSLSSCFDQMFKTEYIEDFKCERCRLAHALELLKEDQAKSNSEKFKQKSQQAIDKLQTMIDTNPEGDIGDLELPDMRYAPKRKIAKHVRITKFPKVVAIHLSRSIYDARTTMKNSAKVSFPEKLPLGGLTERRNYRLLSVVCHKGSHHSGHYESFRRQNVYPPFSTPNAFQGSNVYSKPPTPNPSQISTPQLKPAQKPEDPNLDGGMLSTTPEILSPASAASSSSLPLTNGKHSGESSRDSNSSPFSPTKTPGPTSAARNSETSSLRSVARSARESLSSKLSSGLGRTTDERATLSPSANAASPLPPGNASRVSLSDAVRGKRKKPPGSNRWWRISDEKVKEAKTSEVLGMQKEVYMLFYELEKDE